MENDFRTKVGKAKGESPEQATAATAIEYSCHVGLWQIKWPIIEERELRVLMEVKEARRKRIQELFESFMTRVERSIRALASRLLIMLSFFLILCISSGFPTDPGQPSCSTMPWNIRPALVVLWGVCWMFARPPSQVNPEDRSRVKGGVDFTILGKFTQYICLVFAPINKCHRPL